MQVTLTNFLIGFSFLGHWWLTLISYFAATAKPPSQGVQIQVYTYYYTHYTSYLHTLHIILSENQDGHLALKHLKLVFWPVIQSD